MNTQKLRRLVFYFSFAALILLAPFAFAQEDDLGLTLTSTSGASVGGAVPSGIRLALQSQACSFHYRVCASACTALQTDVYVAQGQLFDVQLTADRKYLAVACDGTTTGAVRAYQVNLP